ncbi:acyl-CoA-binding domain-containing protein 1-like [Bidens hawaiensis]|uniref:acyl-CoA-binding domain-containing protein 1-like n=1 Tax=Bidens hawaiensis TaxID=980011 RepID=UPI0040492CA8
MATTDSLQYLQSILLALIVSFLLAKLFSIIFSSGDDSNNNTLISTNVRRSDAEFTRKEIAATAGDDDDDHDWEGVETSELDAAFCAANAFVAAQKVAYDVKLKLYRMYKVATEGACSVPVPSAIKITARAKWNAWYKLGAMSQEEAMHKYLDIITELYPSWADGSTFKRRGGENNETTSKDTKPMGPDLSSFVHEEEFKLDDDMHDFSREDQTRADHDQVDVAEVPLSTNAADMILKDNEGLGNAAVGEPDETSAKKNAVDDEGK